MIVKIKRQCTPDSAPYWQSFSYNGPLHVTISAGWMPSITLTTFWIPKEKPQQE